MNLPPDPYADALDRMKKTVMKAQDSISAPGVLDLDSPDLPVTMGILNRMRAYYQWTHRAKKAARKQVGMDGADFFTETVACYIQAAARSNGLVPDDMDEAYQRGVFVSSEESLLKKRGSSRPDVTLWRKGKPFAVIECKTQMGWARTGWEQAFREREKELTDEIPGIEVNHIVLTNCNWPGLSPNHPRTGKNWFCLYKHWPSEWPEDPRPHVQYPIEPLLKRLFGL
jgi:hypothetical protein